MTLTSSCLSLFREMMLNNALMLEKLSLCFLLMNFSEPELQMFIKCLVIHQVLYT